MKRSKPSRTIAFRLPAAFEERLLEQAAEAGRSSHIHARELVVSGLKGREAEFDAELAALRATFHAAHDELRRDLATILESLLVNLGVAEEEVRVFVSERLRNRC